MAAIAPPLSRNCLQNIYADQTSRKNWQIRYEQSREMPNSQNSKRTKLADKYKFEF